MSEAPFKAFDIAATSSMLYSSSTMGMTGKFNSMEKEKEKYKDGYAFPPELKTVVNLSASTTVFIAVTTPNRVMNSIAFPFTNPEVKGKWEAAKVAWPHIFNCKHFFFP